MEQSYEKLYVDLLRLKTGQINLVDLLDCWEESLGIQQEEEEGQQEGLAGD